MAYNSNQFLGTCWASASAAIQQAPGIESDHVANCCFPKTWPADREQGARVIGGWLKTEAQFYVKHQARSSISFWLWSPPSCPSSFAGCCWSRFDPTTKHVLRSVFPYPL